MPDQFVLPDGQRFWLPDPQQYAVEQERQRHADAIYHYGEYSMFALMWKAEDFTAGLVRRCPTCYIAYGKTAEAYGQSAVHRCPDCFGTTFEGGYKAKIVRPAMWDIQASHFSEDRTGETEEARASVQSTPDFAFRTGDYAFRGDGTRYQIATLYNDLLVTGFEVGTDAQQSMGYNVGQATLEAKTAVAYDIPPDGATLITLLSTKVNHPVDFSTVEEIRGPLF